MINKTLPKEEPKENPRLGSQVTVRRMSGSMHDDVNVIDITLKSEVESIDQLLKRIPGVI